MSTLHCHSVSGLPQRFSQRQRNGLLAKKGLILSFDDYSKECARSLEHLLRTSENLGLPVALPKLEGPSTCLTFLGIEIDTRSLEIRLPDTKLRALQDLILGRESCERRELESLVGSLSHTCCVVQSGKILMFQLLSVARKAHRSLRLNQSYRSDLFCMVAYLFGSLKPCVIF